MKEVPIYRNGPQSLQDYSLSLKEAIEERTPVPDRITITGREHPRGILLESVASIATADSTSALYLTVLIDPDTKQTCVGVSYGELNGDPPTDFPVDFSPFLLTPLDGENSVWLEVTTDDETLAVTNVTVEQGTDPPDGEDFIGYHILGTYIKDSDGLRVVYRNPGSVYYVNGNGEHYFWH